MKQIFFRIPNDKTLRIESHLSAILFVAPDASPKLLYTHKIVIDL